MAHVFHGENELNSGPCSLLLSNVVPDRLYFVPSLQYLFLPLTTDSCPRCLNTEREIETPVTIFFNLSLSPILLMAIFCSKTFGTSPFMAVLSST